MYCSAYDIDCSVMNRTFYEYLEAERTSNPVLSSEEKINTLTRMLSNEVGTSKTKLFTNFLFDIMLRKVTWEEKNGIVVSIVFFRA